MTLTEDQIATDILAGGSVQDLIRQCGAKRVESAFNLLDIKFSAEKPLEP